ncbi:MAG TPA: hypothetical protein VGC99_26305 [Candidatus Tectomicrobia bacterium]
MQEPLAKLERAGEHLAVLNAEVSAYSGREPKPYRIVTKEYSDAEGNFTIKIPVLQIIERPPVRLGIVIGEFAESLRASLDYLVWQLSLLTKPDLDTLPDDRAPVTDVSFPIFRTRPPGGLQANRRLQFVPDEARDIIETLQPYNVITPPMEPWVDAESSWLWILYRFSNRAKHRTINPVGLGVAITYLDAAGNLTSRNERVMGFDDETPLAPIPDEGKLEIEISLDVRFSEAIFNQSIRMDTLNELYRFVREQIFPRFMRFLE